MDEETTGREPGTRHIAPYERTQAGSIVLVGAEAGEKRVCFREPRPDCFLLGVLWGTFHLPAALYEEPMHSGRDKTLWVSWHPTPHGINSLPGRTVASGDSGDSPA